MICRHCHEPRERCEADGICYDRAGEIVAAMLDGGACSQVDALYRLRNFATLESRFDARVWAELFAEQLREREAARTHNAMRRELIRMPAAQRAGQLVEDIRSSASHAFKGVQALIDIETAEPCLDVVRVTGSPLPAVSLLRLAFEESELTAGYAMPDGSVTVACGFMGHRRREWCAAVVDFLTERGWSASVEIEGSEQR